MTTQNKKYKAALDFATKKHEGQTRIGGKPYISHPVEVAEIVRAWGYNTEYQIAALFHDLLEDTDATENEIKELGGTRVLLAVKALTKVKPYTMKDYVGKIKSRKISRVVKAADRLHNLRSAVVADESFKRRYILESLEWYTDLCPEIYDAMKTLALTMEDKEEFAYFFENDK